MNKVIFLDLDGVLNNSTWAIEMFNKDIRVYHDDLLYGPSLELLRRIVDEVPSSFLLSVTFPVLNELVLVAFCFTNKCQEVR